MRTYYLVILVFFIVCAVFLAVFLGTKTKVPTNGLEIEVFSGQVDYQTNDDDSRLSVSAGQTIRVTDRESPKLLITPALIKKATDSQEEIVEPPVSTIVITLTVSDTAGHPIANASGTILNNNESQSFQLNDQGQTILKELSVGEAVIDVYHPSLFNNSRFVKTIEADTERIDIIAARRAILAGYVINAFSEPVSGAEIRLNPVNDEFDLPQSTPLAQKTDSNGLFSFNPLVLGEYIVSVSAPSYLPLQKTLSAAIQSTTVTLTLSTHSQVRVSVLDQNSLPVYHAKVTMQLAQDSGFRLIQETSESTGQTLFESIPPGLYEIFAEHVWFKDETENKKTVEIKSSEEKVTLTLNKREYNVSGRVFDEQSGEGVSGVEVYAFLEERINTLKRVCNLKNGKYEVKPDAKTSAESDGAFQFEGLPGGSYTIGVPPQREYVYRPFTSHFDFGRKTPTIMMREESDIEGVEIGLQRSWAVSGKVTLNNGTPLSDARIRLRAEYEDDGQTGEDYGFIQYIAFGEGENDGDYATITGSDGTYRFQGNQHVFSSSFKLYINTDHNTYRKALDGKGKQIKPKPGEELSGIDLVYESKAVVRGLVTDTDGEPLRAVAINLKSEEKWGEFYTNSDGAYEAYIKPGEYEVWAHKGGYQSKKLEQPIVLEENQELDNINFVLEEGDESFEGVVMNEDGEPVSRIMLDVHSESPEWFVGHTISNREGRFKVEASRPVPSDITQFIVRVNSNETYESASVTINERWAKNIQIILQKREEDYGSIAGIVLDEQDQPIQNYEIKLTPTGTELIPWSLREKYFDWRSVSNPDGVYVFNEIPVANSPFVVMARAENMAPAFSEVIHLNKDESRQNVTIILKEETFSLSGRALDAAGQAVSKTRVLFRPQLNSDLQDMWDQKLTPNDYLTNSYPQTYTDEQGNFKIANVPVSGGILGIVRGYENDEWITMDIMILPGQPGEERNLGEIIIQ